MLRFWIAAITILALHTAAAADQSARDNRANQLNPNNDAYWSSRGIDRHSSEFEDDDKAARDNRANQPNPNTEAYRQRRMRDIVRDIEAAAAAKERWNCCEGVWCRPQFDEIASTLTTNRRNGIGTIVLYRRASGRNIGDAVVVDTKLEIEDGVPVWRFRNHPLGKRTNRSGSLMMMRGIRPEQDERGDATARYTVIADPGPPPDDLKTDIEKSVWAAVAGRVTRVFNCRKR